MTHDFPTILEVVEMHEALIDRFGGARSILDRNALESALQLPQFPYYSSLVQKAAALMESLANNHPFVDGNKRVAFFMTDTFLRMNGYFIDCDNEDAYRFFIGLFETNSFRLNNLQPWLEEQVTPLPAV